MVDAMTITQEEVKGLFVYQDGLLFWRSNRRGGSIEGSRAGGLHKPTGYRNVSVFNKKLREHRVIFLYHHGVMPEQIDHINGIKDDNRIENLRAANSSQNQINTGDRRHGMRGVRKGNGKDGWVARIYVNRKEVRIGVFPSPEEASAAYRAKAKELFGEFVR